MDKLSYDIYICGVGGQGIIKASVIIGEAAMKKKMNVVMSEIHGMAQRGGVVSTEVRLGDVRGSTIPESHADLMIAFEPLEALRALPKIHEKSTVVVNTSIIPPFNLIESEYPYPSLNEIIDKLEQKSAHVYPFNAEKIALEAGHILSMNMVMLGAATATKSFPLRKREIITSMRENLPRKLINVNLKAFDGGFKKIKHIII